ncbi:MAG TPA: [FeFe] hydrogenase H-cluster radical SAM maturase HydE [Armatimonadota bacterium]|nr:[FeFe] hydrogenase H-cluster radical SAM maturase HydE [Armatimonadota bacterium]
MPTEAIESWLREDREDRLQALWRSADAVRREHVGDAVHLRGLIEISNVCVRSCAYCGLRAPNRDIDRYRMSEAEIMDCVAKAVEFGYGTVVMQAGEDPGIECEWLSRIISRIKSETPLAVTLSLGERPMDDLRAWREAGADRYLLRFETSDRALYDAIHPPLPGRVSDRIVMLREIKALGYEAGSGVLIGLPGQTYRSLAEDIALFRELDLDMIGVGPYIPHPDTPLGQQVACQSPVSWSVPPTEQMAYKVVALARIVRPDANIPSTTALATINQVEGRELGLQRGANVVMPNLTPPEYRMRYEIYPGKACVGETAEQCRTCLRGRIESIGRTIGLGQGGRAKMAV